MKSHIVTCTLAAVLGLCSALVGSPVASSSMLIEVKGRLTSITETDYLVEAETSVYYVSRKFVEPSEARKITRADLNVTFVVPPEGITLVRKKQKTAANTR